MNPPAPTYEPAQVRALACRQLTRTFPTPGGPLHVLRGVDLEVAPAQIVAILGPSGSGKSTLLHLLGGLDRPSSGVVLWGAREVQGLPQGVLARERARTLGLVFQHHYLLEDLTVLENVTLSGRLRGRVDEARGRDLLARTGLLERASFLPRRLSGGERQRAAVARALYNRPRVVLADEPTGSLDRVSARSVYELLAQLAQEEGSAVVMVTHDEGLVERVDARFRLQDGVLVPA
ncbi:ABC transporter ATP-binding protein [Truepera radiovictrix]|nr:ABC transporter ATP-binding protein [Truepera radiovictrix]WMT57030.1 ABC transporter ATP-binding protein [Truepera radiovictrix]